MNEHIFYMKEIGQWVKEVTIHRYNNGVYEPYTEYEPVDRPC